MRQIAAVVLGCGSRGKIYADYSLKFPNELKIIAVVDTSEKRLAEAKQKYRAENAFSDLDSFLDAEIKCDFVINCTLDSFHYESTMRLMERGYNILLEKPVTSDAAELFKIYEKSKETGVKLLVCHVLRYTPFYRTAKEIVASGVLGKVRSVETGEYDSPEHFLDSYVRGIWKSEEECGSGLLLAKSSHDIDLICWLNGDAAPQSVFSFGSRGEFIPENAPEGSADRCVDCKFSNTCAYSAVSIYLGSNYSTNHTFADIDSGESKSEYLKNSSYGECAYKTGGDIVDNQTTVIKFKNGSIGTHQLIGSSAKSGRRLQITCEYGAISGNFDENTLEIITFANKNGRFESDRRTVDLTAESTGKGKHGGGDTNLIHDALRYFADGEKTVSITDIESTVPGHLCVYAAEKSRKNGQLCNISDL